MNSCYRLNVFCFYPWFCMINEVILGLGAWITAVTIATEDEETLKLWDFFGLKDTNLDKIIASLAKESLKGVTFGFTPIDCSAY